MRRSTSVYVYIQSPSNILKLICEKNVHKRHLFFRVTWHAMRLKFIRNNKSSQKLSKAILKVNKNWGGLNVTLLNEQSLGLKISWVSRLIIDSDQGWKNIVRYTLPLNNNQFWLCNFNKQSVHSVLSFYNDIPTFWKDFIQLWSEKYTRNS